MVGLDSACWAYYQPLLDAGKLPHLQKLIDRGSSGSLRSTMPALTPAAWASIVTGKNPGKHGIFDMLWRQPGSYDFYPTNSRMRMGLPFWKRLNENGIKVGLVNVPFIHPPDPIDGFIVTGFGAPSGVADFAEPQVAREWILEHYRQYEPWPRFKKGPKGPKPIDKIRLDLEHQGRQVEIALHLAEKFAVQFLAVHLMAPDHANHILEQQSAVDQTLQATDAHLGSLLEKFQPENVMLFSDHGARRVKGDFLLHGWLRDRGYCVQSERPSKEQREVLNAVLHTWLKRRWKLPDILRRLAGRLLLTALSILPDSVQDGFLKRIERTVPFAREHIRFTGNLDPGRSPVFPGSSRSGLLFLNLRGRDPLGVVTPENRETYLADLAAQLRVIRDPFSGEPIFQGVYLAEDIYPGPASPLAPDITIDFYDSPWNVLASFQRGSSYQQVESRYFTRNQGEYGHHARDGLYVFSGPDFEPGRDARLADLVDLPATILYLYDVPIPEDYDGRVMLETFRPQAAAARRLRSQPGEPLGEPLRENSAQAYQAEQNEELMDRLRMLGYVK